MVQLLIHILGACKKKIAKLYCTSTRITNAGHLLIYNFMKQNISIQHYINIQAHNTIQQKSP